MRGKCNQLGLTLGLALAIMHAVWALAVAMTPAGVQKLINWVYSLHFLKIPITVTTFEASRAIVLVVVTFVVGYVIGWLFSVCHAWVEKK